MISKIKEYNHRKREKQLELAKSLLSYWNLTPEEVLILLRDRTTLILFLVTLLTNFAIVFFTTHNVILATYLAIQNALIVLKSDTQQKMVQAKLIVAHSQKYQRIKVEQKIV